MGWRSEEEEARDIEEEAEHWRNYKKDEDKRSGPNCALVFVVCVVLAGSALTTVGVKAASIVIPQPTPPEVAVVSPLATPDAAGPIEQPMPPLLRPYYLPFIGK